MNASLETLFRYLDNLHGRAPLEELSALLGQLDLSCDDLAGHVRFADDHYQRNLVRAGPWYHVWVMCWKSGQRSPIHDHARSGCAVKVVWGSAIETRFEFAPNGHILATGSQTFPPGSVLAARDADLHQISNLQADQADLITLHVYSPPLLRMTTYSLLDRSRGEDVWDEERKIVTSFPENSETPLDNVDSWVTPNRLFFVRNHFDTPVIDRAAWRLAIGGCVERPLELAWSDLMHFPTRSLFATVECAGNGRSFLKDRMPGVPWGAGAIGHAEWTGVPLHLVLEKAGLRPETVEIAFEGADSGAESDHPERMHFARGLPLDKALDPDTLLVYRMNGELLQPAHGFPVRLFVPGWYGVASVKWLRRIEALACPFDGYYQKVKYTVQRRGEHGLETVTLGPMAVKAEIIRPQANAALGLGTNRIFGVAWAGEEAVGDVEVSVDGGKTWSAAELIGQRMPYSWVLWEYLWETAEPGEHVLLARAISASGRVQPAEADPLNGGYMIHFSRPTRVRVDADQRSEEQRGDVGTLLYDMNAYAEENTRFRLDAEMEFSVGGGI